MEPTNPYCDALGIAVPTLETAARSPNANYYSLLIAALLENGAPMTLEAVAERFEDAGIGNAESAIRSLKRCKPARAPVYRDGDLYALDPYDDEADFWAFRLGLKPPRRPRVAEKRPDPEPLPTTDEPLTTDHLREAWRDGIFSTFTVQRVLVCILDAHGRAMSLDEIQAFIAVRSQWPVLSPTSTEYLWRRGSPLRKRDDGTIELVPDHGAIRPARAAIIERLAVQRRWPHRDNVEEIRAITERHKRERAERGAALARLSRVVVYAFPETTPEAVVLIDVHRREMETFIGDALPSVRHRLERYDVIAAVDVRGVLRTLGFVPGARRLGELAPPQKTKMLESGRVLRITLSLLIQGSCGIRRPLADRKVLLRYLRDGRHDKLRARLESNAESLFALYMYGCVHGTVRLRWRRMDEYLPAPWAHRDEQRLYDLIEKAYGEGAPLEVVIGQAPDLADPWARAERATVERARGSWPEYYLMADHWIVDERDVQLARVVGQEVPWLGLDEAST